MLFLTMDLVLGGDEQPQLPLTCKEELPFQWLRPAIS